MKDAANIDLVSLLREGAEEGVNMLFRMHYRPLCYFATNIIGDEKEGEDIETESFLKLLDKRSNFSTLTEINGFLFTATRNACIDFLRKKKSRKEVPLEFEKFAGFSEAELHNELITAQVLQAIYIEMENLPSQCRAIFKAIFIEGKETSTVATQMGLKRQTVLNQKTKALRLMRNFLSKKGIEYAGSAMLILDIMDQKGKF